MKRILIVEDDNILNKTLSFNLRAEGYEIMSAFNVKEAINLFEKSLDLVVLDVNLPDGNGFDLCKKMKAEMDIPVIFLTANDLEENMIYGFKLGADDYVSKPFPVAAFVYKVKALLDRIVKKVCDIYDDGYLIIDFDKLETRFGDEIIQLTSMEYRILKILTDNANKVLTRNILLEKLWDIDANFVDEHTLTVSISRVRGKIERDNHKYIKTIYGMGYMWMGVRDGI